MINLNDKKQAFASIHPDRHTNGGPAFQIPLHPGQTYTAHALCDGMTLRDYFAAKAMQAAISSKNCPESLDGAVVATVSYAMADAMLRARGEA